MTPRSKTILLVTSAVLVSLVLFLGGIAIGQNGWNMMGTGMAHMQVNSPMGNGTMGMMGNGAMNHGMMNRHSSGN